MCRGGLEFYEINGRLVTFDSVTHTYTVDGNRVRSVTEYIRDYLKDDSYKNIPEHVLENAARKGTELHEMIERYEKDQVLPKNPTSEFLRYMVERKAIDRVVAQEKIVVIDCVNETIAGRFDMLAIVNGKPTLIDFKRNSRAYKDKYEWQLNLYARGIKACYGTTVQNKQIWRFYNDKFQKIEF